ncbi:MAG: response regulator transcription factor [Clostridia bacterium]|nr:response regulator transcription factor [Clostridia bacterium]
MFSSTSSYPDTAPIIKLGQAYSNELSRREVDVLRELTKGKSNKEIARQLEISEETVNFHIKRILKKTGFQNRTILAVEARRLGFVINWE